MGASQVISNRAPRIQFGPANQVGPEKGRQILINLNHIPIFQIDAKHNCQTCVETKLTRLSFQSVERHTEPIDLIHSDIYVISNLYKQYICGNKYFITFVDDNTKYCYVYLLKSKDEAIEKFVFYKNGVKNLLDM